MASIGVMETVKAQNTWRKDQSSSLTFSVTGSRELSLSVDCAADKVSAFLAHRVARKPKDLLVHVQRIKLAAKYEMTSCLRGALLDLYITLGSQGRELRQCMLDLALSVLDKESIEFLVDGLETGLRASDPVPDPGASVLCKGISGRVDLIGEQRSDSTREADPFEQLFSLVELAAFNVGKCLLQGIYFARRTGSLLTDQINSPANTLTQHRCPRIRYRITRT